MAEERVRMTVTRPSAKTKIRKRLSEATIAGIIKQDGEERTFTRMLYDFCRVTCNFIVR
jgi:hypothetical protein